MITAEQAQQLSLDSRNARVKTQLDSVVNKITQEASSGSGVQWIIVEDLYQSNKLILEQQGFELTRETSGASKGHYRVTW